MKEKMYPAPGCMVIEVSIALLHHMLEDNTDQSRCLNPYFLFTIIVSVRYKYKSE